jgi:hypothetical protein
MRFGYLVGFYLVFVAPLIFTTWLAARQGRNAALWFLAAFFVPVVAPVVLAVIAASSGPIPREPAWDTDPDLRRGL